MPERRSVRLEIYVEAGCSPCERARRLAQELEEEYPEISVGVIDIDQAAGSESEVFAVPTYVLDGRIVSLGNPRPDDLRGRIEALLSASGRDVD